MPTKSIPILKLSQLITGEAADVFALLYQKEEQRTKDNKPFHRVGFRDATCDISFPLWNDSPHAEDCRIRWQIGSFYKLRCALRETSFGPQLEIHKIRETTEADSADGFDPDAFRPHTRFDPAEMFTELSALAQARIADLAIRRLTQHLLMTHREALLTLPAATKNHHAESGGWLEHVLSATRNAVFFADRYAEHYPDLSPPLDKDLVVAGTILHDIGKLRELEWRAEGPAYTEAGSVVGHVVQGRDMVREAAAELTKRPAGGDDSADPPFELVQEKLLRLEHIILSHQRLPEWGAPKPPMTPEAMLVHYADDLDAKMNMIYHAFRDDKTPGHTTSKKNVLMQSFYRGTASGR